MGQKLSDDQCIEAVKLIEECLREGCKLPGTAGPGTSALAEAGRRAVERGICLSLPAYRSRLDTAKSRGFIPDEALYRETRYSQPLPKAVLEHAPPQDPAAFTPQGDSERVLIIPDLHQDPRHPDRINVLKWIARFGAEKDFKRVVQLGDWSTWDSASSHDKNDTLKGQQKPSITDDMNNLIEGLRMWQAAKGDWRPKQLITLGNHEHRLERFENKTPETSGVFSQRRDEIFTQFGWQVSPYSEVRYVCGVGLTHHPTNAAGRAFGGKTGAQRAANEAACSMIYGHTHAWKFVPAAKLGPMVGVDMLEAGCAMKWGEVEAYAMHSNNDWWWGVTEVTLWGGRIHEVARTSMLTLQKKYGGD